MSSCFFLSWYCFRVSAAVFRRITSGFKALSGEPRCCPTEHGDQGACGQFGNPHPCAPCAPCLRESLFPCSLQVRPEAPGGNIERHGSSLALALLFIGRERCRCQVDPSTRSAEAASGASDSGLVPRPPSPAPGDASATSVLLAERPAAVLGARQTRKPRDLKWTSGSHLRR